MPDLARLSPFTGLTAAPVPAVSLDSLAPIARFAFRGGPDAVAAAGTALGVALPQEACRAAASDEGAALWLGPDEWLFLVADEQGPAMLEALTAALKNLPHALVEVSHRNTALEVSGPKAAEVLNAGCPLDLDLGAFPVQACTRTLLGKAEIVLWRTGEDSFHLDVWRSFAPYVWGFIEEARREHAG